MADKIQMTTQMIKKKKTVAILFVVFFLLSAELSAQHEIKKINLYVVPFSVSTLSALSHNEVRENSSIIINIKESIIPQTMDDLYEMLGRLNDKDTMSKIWDYRLECVFYKKKGKKEYLYMNSFGFFMYNGKYYRNDKIADFIRAFLPPSCRQ